MFEKVIVFGLFEMIQKKNEDRVPESRIGLRVGSGMAIRAVTNLTNKLYEVKRGP